MTSPAVSVLMPVYNAASTLPETLHTVQSQTLQDIEIVIVDDGSDDGSRSILESAQLTDSRIVYCSRPHLGLIEALNHGLRLCRSELVARMDADDLMHRDRLREQAALMHDQPHVNVASSLVETIAATDVGEGMRIYERWLNGLVSHEDICREIFIESPLAHPSVMFRRHELQDMGGYLEMGWPEDYDLWLRYHSQGSTFAKVPRVLLQWRDHPDRATRTDRRYSVENFIRAKAHYLLRGPIRNDRELLIWGAGQTGRRLSKYLKAEERPPGVFVDINTSKIGGTLRGIPIAGPDDLPGIWYRSQNPIMLVAVASRGARQLIRDRLNQLGLAEGNDYICVA